MCPVQCVTYVSGRSSLTDLRICRASVLHEIRSARSAINVRGRLSLRKVEAESHFLSPLLSVLYVFDYLSPVACAHVRVLMSHPIVNQDLAAFRPEQHRFPKSAESIEANASSSHPLEDCRETVTEKTFGRKHISATSLQQKSFFANAAPSSHYGAEELLPEFSGITPLP
jgi:hypothetical protein